MYSIVIVDESVHEVRPLLTDLSIRGLNVKVCPSADDCLELIMNGQKPNLFVLDVMLLSKGAFSQIETDDFLYTGLLLGRVIREILIDVPIMFFTSMSLASGLLYINETIESLGNSIVVRKHEIGKPHEFYDHIIPILESGRVQSKSVVGTFADNVLIQPNFAGIGFDVKKFLKELVHRKKKK